MALLYGNMRADVIWVQQWDRRSSYDDTRKLMFHETVATFRLVFHPHEVAYALVGALGAFNETPQDRRRPAWPQPGQAVLGAGTVWMGQTEEALRQYMMTPRRALTYTVTDLQTPAAGDGREVLVAPARRPGGGFYDSDAAHGPIPLGFRWVKRHGNKTLEADWTVAVTLNDCHYFSSTPPAMVSHVWRMRRTVDQDHFSTRTIHGRATFRTDRLAQLGAKPDDFVHRLGHSVPQNMQRIRVETSPNEAGTAIDYMIVDTERPTNIEPGVFAAYGVTRIEAYHTAGMGKTAFHHGLTGIFGGGVLATNTGAAGDPFGVDPFALATRGVGGLLKVIPGTSVSIMVRVWGNRQSTRVGLAAVARLVALRVFDAEGLAGILPRFFSTTDYQLTADLMGQFVEFRVSLQGGPVSRFFGTNRPRTLNIFERMFPTSEIPGITLVGSAENPFPPGSGSNKMRGTWPEALSSQTPEEPCHSFSSPPPSPGLARNESQS